MRRRPLVIAASAAFLCALVALSCDLRPRRDTGTVMHRVSFRAEGALKVGAARQALDPHLPAVVAGYTPARPVAERADTPLSARAVVIEIDGKAVAIASVDVLEVPLELVERVRERVRPLGVRDVLVGATHTHSGMGGFEPSLYGQIAAMGRYREAVAGDLEDSLVRAVTEAHAATAAATMRIGDWDLDASENRAWPDGPVDPRLTLFAFDDERGAPVGKLVIYGAHPTNRPRKTPALDGDYPARAMARVEQEGGVALFLQGAVGDVRCAPPPGIDPRQAAEVRMAETVAHGVEMAELTALSADAAMEFGAVRFSLPPAEADGVVPRLFRRGAANALELLLPEEAEVAVVKLGGRTLLFTSAEPTVAAAEALREALGDARASVIGVADGYIGYLEMPERFDAVEGEAGKTVYGRGLLKAVSGAARACVGEAR